MCGWHQVVMVIGFEESKCKMRSRRLYALKLAVHIMIMCMWRWAWDKASLIASWGSNSSIFTKWSWTRKGFQLEASIKVIIKLKLNVQGKGIPYLGFPSFAGLIVLGGRPDYRFDSRTIKRDSRASSLITSHVESSNLCITCIILSCWSWVVLYVRTLGFSIASKRAQDHRIRSPYAKVITVLVGCCRLFWEIGRASCRKRVYVLV